MPLAGDFIEIHLRRSGMPLAGYFTELHPRRSGMPQIPVILELRMFQILVICHIMATICSVIAYIYLILAEKSDCHTAIVASKHATALLIIAHLPVLIAFLAVISTHGKLPSLTVATYCLGFVLFVLLILGATWSEVVFIRDLVRLLRRLFWMTRKTIGWLLGH
ncbi:hypothetical protein EUGRSUZ_K00837 [Eucalyptus grandis]|uniref:Uncharacterized protein n=2 Tax=Eucalyptus grandis TaxID=71139 RepID=A0ACC3ITM3_EUCGR|nr:hypothetical protein EUGRSUZ_K00837 [Eucalyptus grandis]